MDGIYISFFNRHNSLIDQFRPGIAVCAARLTSEEFAMGLLRQEHVAVVPDNAFNKAGDGYIRIACTLDTQMLLRAAEKITRFAAQDMR